LTTEAGREADAIFEKGPGFVKGKIRGAEFAFSTNPGQVYATATFTTDSLALTWEGSNVFAALCTRLEKDGHPVIRSSQPITCDLSETSLKYYLAESAEVNLGIKTAPGEVLLNGKKTSRYVYDRDKKELRLTLPAGEGLISWK
jgi:hypothetical protein